MQRAIASHGALAILYGRHSKHYIKKPEVFQRYESITSQLGVGYWILSLYFLSYRVCNGFSPFGQIWKKAMKYGAVVLSLD